MIRQGKVVKLHLSRHLAHRRENVDEQLAKRIGAHAVEVVLSLATGLDQSGHPQQRQVVADRGLALPQPVAEVRDVKFAVLRQVRQDAKS